MNPSAPFDLEGAISRYFDGNLEPGELPLLAGWIREDPSHAMTFARRALLHHQIRGSLQCDAAVRELPPRALMPANRSLTVRVLVAALIPLCLGLWAVLAHREPARTSPATLTAETDAEWSDEGTGVALRGGDLPAGTLHLEKGLAEFRFANGATVVIEGPAEFELLGPAKLLVGEGRVLCRCPGESSHMTVVTSATEIADLGTEFAVIAAKDLSTRVTVIEGAVNVILKERSQRFSAGQAVEVGRDHASKPASYQPSEFTAMRAMDSSARQSTPDGKNLLADPGFETHFVAGTQGIKSSGLGEPVWKGSKGLCVRAPRMGRGNTGAAKIEAKGDRYWPWVGQKVETGDISGRHITATVWAMHPTGDALGGGQNAILKVTFLDAANHDISNAERRFLTGDAPRDQFIRCDLAADAPAGTVRVIFAVMLNARGRSAGTVFFDDAVLSVSAK